MNRYLKAILVFLGWWLSGTLVGILVGTLLGGENTSLFVITPAFAYGLYSAYKIITKKNLL